EPRLSPRHSFRARSGRAPDKVEALPQMHNARKAERSLADEIVLLEDLCETMKFGSLCALGGFTPYPVLSALRNFPEDFGADVTREAAE
ncbi:MAG: NADH-ubiquinone oxidoreductase-F iron-sulfur binding region domain-containing protein, partial [Novosphingobium sp.]